MEGQVLGNRYELIEKIGGGGMALVYKAKCRLLNRFVAIKILRNEFENNEEFVQRFVMEAQSAASLSHPNIVSIYDVGHEGNTHYIVMEYVDGITLKQYLLQKGVLKWREAVNIAIQICSAIEHAHRNHIIHRDIKPHNILLTRDGIAKVTDFGIARAVSSSTITMAGSTIGSVHYFSPEQARGGYIDEKSDLYSLGIALYELVTGRLPFDGDTPVAVALKHIQVDALSPVDIDHNIPLGVNNIIMKAIKKDQNMRYPTASQMLSDLYRVLKQPDGQFVVEESVEDFPTRKIQMISGENLIKEGKNAVKPGEQTKKKGDKLTVALAVITSLIIIAMFGFMTYKLVGPTVITNKQDFEMKNYVGKDINDVENELRSAGFTNINKTRKPDDTAKKDTVIGQTPEQGKKLKPGDYTSIELVVSDGPKMVKLPEFKKEDYRTAEKELRDLGLNPQIQDEFSDTVVTGLVTRTDPEANEMVKPDSTVVIFKSKGPELKMVKVPDLTGKTKVEAQKVLSDAKLVLGKTFPEDGKNFVDKIVKQDPLPNTDLKEGDPVNITLETNNTQSKFKNVERMIILNNPNNFKDIIKVYVEVQNQDTGKTDVIMNATKRKTEFPLTLVIPVPENGKVKVSVYLDDMTRPYVEFAEELAGGQ